jgi:hypothetical protein
MGKLFEHLITSVEKGRTGDFKGIPIPFKRLVKYIPNIQQKTYYLIGAKTKIGKTTLGDELFMYGPLDYILGNPDCGIQLDIDYFSYEIDIRTKVIKAVGRAIWYDYGIIADVNTILSKGENHCSDEIYNIVKTYREYFDRIEDHLTVHDIPDNPTGIRNYLLKKAESRGRIEKKNINKDPNGDPMMRFDRYVPNNPNLYWIVIIDHIALMSEERGFNTKQNIDKMSQYLVNLRNNFGITPVVIQQLSGEVDNDERFKSNRLTPTLRDFGDSKYTTRDANVIMALFSPYQYSIHQFEGYNITKLGNTFRNLEILANRDGEPNINIGLNFVDKVGTFREFPAPKDMTDVHYHNGSNLINGRPKYIKENGIWQPRPN